VATDGARVVATAGLPEMLAATRFEGPDPLANPAALLDQPAEARRLVDLMRANREPEGMRFGIAVQCRLRAERIAADETLLLVQEQCRARGFRRFTNRFWADTESGTILRSEQWVGEGLPPMVVEFFSPAS
jgi:Group 4 capsule polysaccharide lipoprotein gfcB, YjbF